MRKYCRAYHLRDLRQFGGWEEKHAAGNAALSDDTIVYLWDDFTVARSPIHRDTLLFDQATPQWQSYCTVTLKFAIPDELRYADTQSSVETTL